MNTFYDKEGAASALRRRLSQLAESDMNADVMHLSDIQTCTFQVYAVEEPPSYRLKEHISDVAEEVTFRVRGIICHERLPPVYSCKNANALPHLRQTVHLVSLGAGEGFDRYFNITSEVVKLFQDSVRGKVQGPGTQVYEGERTLVLGTPYFSRRSLTPNLESLPLGLTVDPTGFLSRNQPQNFHHTMDNQVMYLRAREEESGIRFTTTSPADFGTGDIVEAQFSFVAIPLYKKKDEYQLCMCLRALVLLDDTFKRDSMATTGKDLSVPIPTFALKRKATSISNIGDEADIGGKDVKRVRGA